MLYNKYRPKKISDLVGQNEVQNFLYRVTEQNYPKTLIFAGPSGAGKTTSVRLFASKLYYPDDQNRDILENAPSLLNEFDYLEMSGVENSGVDDMRSLKDRASLAGMSGKPRIFVIDEAHGLSQKAFDALLKITEESNKNVFCFLTTEYDKIPKTIKTRSVQYIFTEPDVHQIKSYVGHIANLEGYKLTDELAGVIAFKSDNSYRSALVVLEKVLPQLTKSHVNDIGAIKNVEGLLQEEEIDALKKFPSYLKKYDLLEIANLVKSFKTNDQELKNFCFYMYNYSRKLAFSTRKIEHLRFVAALTEVLKDNRMPLNKIAIENELLKLYLKEKDNV